jgi:hypothetical protein
MPRARMPNVTITVSDQLKTEMDNFPEVSWSEICRNAISQYIEQRKNPTPRIELDLSEARLDPEGWVIGQPALVLTLRVHNKTASEVTIDRTLFSVRFTGDGNQIIVGSGYDLFKRIINANSVGGGQAYLVLPREKIESLAKAAFKKTFFCTISCTVFVEGYKNPHTQDVQTRIPIDEWRELLERGLTPTQQ